MEFSAPLATFIKPLQNICAIASVAAANSDDISQNVVLTVKDGTLTMRATNYRIELSYTVPVSTITDGEILVLASKLRDTLSKLPQSSLVSFVCQDDGDDLTADLTVSTGQTTYKIRTRSAENFPDFDAAHEDVEQVIAIEQGKFRRIIERSLFCISQEEFREYLRGMRLEVEDDLLTVFTSDGHRMAMLETTLSKPLAGNYGVTLIRPCAAELYKILENSDEVIELSFTKNTVSTVCNGFKLSSKLLICNFPNVRSVLPRDIKSAITVNRTEMKSEISKVAVLSSKRINGVNLVFADGFLNLRSENSEHEVATSQMPINYQGTPADVTLNASYVNEVLAAMDCEEVVFNFSQPIINALITPADEGPDSKLHTRYIISRVVV
ncbi:MAG: DNA polymerase III subunit beta [Candidatus Anaerobiospirillum merdipullorum]|uniref:Beta sliding clamp n=1 Tax=Candidatus Anaerobiospirillum merdipullorum TaxID=2838450 RepID=A0A9E2KP35_9GAMM|nr:DNA polymerase III subunit beta [Candidatus Anaerobiospirillum merdipullorum]